MVRSLTRVLFYSSSGLMLTEMHPRLVGLMVEPMILNVAVVSRLVAEWGSIVNFVATVMTWWD